MEACKEAKESGREVDVVGRQLIAAHLIASKEISKPFVMPHADARALRDSCLPRLGDLMEAARPIVLDISNLWVAQSNQ
eukprot:2167261-Pyramimonas_sp.AAC.1